MSGASGDGAASPQPRRARIRLRTALTVLVAAALATGAALIASGAIRSTAAVETAASPTRLAVDAVGGAQPAPATAVPERLRIPVIGLTAEIRATTAGDSAVVNPPTADEVFWLDDFGLVGADAENTAYLVGHTSADGHAVFDPLVDRETRSSTLQPGDELLVDTASGTAVYEVLATEVHGKAGLAESAEVWAHSPGRLVLITCLFDAQGNALENLVVYSRLIGGA